MSSRKKNSQMWNLRVTTLILLVVGYIVVIFYPSVAIAQCKPELVDQPEINTVAIGESIALTGAGFCKDMEVSIVNESGISVPLNVNYEDESHITVPIGSEIAVGAYKLLIGGIRLRITIVPAFKIELGKVTPEYVYNTDTADRQVSIHVANIEGDSKDKTLSISLIGPTIVAIPADQIEYNLGISQTIAITIPSGTTPGIYEVSLETPLVVTATNTVTVRPPINPSIDKISPDTLRQFDGGNFTFAITGTNLSNVKSVAFSKTTGSFSSADYHRQECPSNGCKSNSSETAIIVDADLALNGSGEYNVAVSFEDGDFKFITVSVIERVWPANASGIIILISGLLGIGFIVWGTYYRRLLVNIEDELIANRQIVSNRRVIMTLLIAGVLTSLSTSIASAIWNGILSSSTFYWVIGLASFNTATLFVLNRVNRVFHDAIGSLIRYSVLIFLLIAIWLSLYLLDFFWEPGLAILVEIILFVVILLIGLVGLAFVRQSLEIERNRLDDAQILTRAETLLLSKGEIKARSGEIDAPIDRIEKAIEILNERYRDRLITYDPVAGVLAFVRSQQIQMVHDAFATTVEPLFSTSQSTGVSVSRAGKVMALFDNELGFQSSSLKSSPEKSTYPFVVHGRSAPDLPWLPQNFPIILLDSDAPFGKDELQQLREIRNDTQVKHRFGIFVPLTNVEQSKLLIDAELRNKRGATNENLVILEKQEMLDIFSSNLQPIYKALLVPIRDQVDLQVFESIFVTFGPVSETMFYGRSQELGSIFDTVDGGNSVTIMGTRKMGKTSLLRRLEKQFKDRGKVVLYADLHAVASYTGFYYMIADKWDTLGLNIQSWSEPHHFLEYVTRFQEQHSNEPIVFMFDEVDRLLDTDMKQGELLFRLFRSLSQEGKCQFVFTGERTILDAVADANSAFWNFTVPIKLPLFDREVTKNLIVEPFTSIGVTLQQQNELVDTIYEYTSGHPTLIQTFCQQALKLLNREENRRLTPSIVQTVAKSLKYQEDASNPFLGVFLSQSTDLEKAIAVHIAHRGAISKAAVLNELREQGFPMTKSLLERGVRYLSLGHVLTLREDGTYQIKPSHLGEYMFTVPYEEYMSDLLDEYRDKNGG